MAGARRVVIVGNGIAGILVASRIRFLEPDPEKVSLSIYSREPHEHYSRIRLPEIFATEMGPEALRMYKPEWYASKSIQLFHGEEVVRIDRASRTLDTRGGRIVAYDDLVLCTGADAIRPPIPGSDLKGVHVVREYGDALAIRRRLAEGTREAAVVGGGLLGLEASYFLREAGVAVTVLELEGRLLPRQLDETGSRLLCALMEKRGSKIVLSAVVSAFVGQGQVTGVRLADGSEIAAGTVLITAGVRPRTELAREAGLEVARGIVVDDRLATSDPAIWAAGDVVEFQGTTWGIIPAAMEHAPVVAANLLDRNPVRYRKTIPRNTLKVAGVELESFGEVNAVAGPEVEVFAKLHEARGHYEKYVLRDGALEGCLLLGSRENHDFAAAHIGRATTEGEIRAVLR